MKTSIKLGAQVEQYVKSLAPEPRGRVTAAIKGLAKNQGDIKQLEGRLQAYSRLRIAGHRVIFRESAKRGERLIECIFAEKRSLVYDLFIRLLAEHPEK